MSQQMANLHTLGPIVVAQKSGGGPGTPSLGCLRRTAASKDYYTYIKVINIICIYHMYIYIY